MPRRIPPTLAFSDSNFLISSGRVGHISRTTNKQGLVRLFSAANLQDFIAHGPEGEGNFPATRVMFNDQRSLDIIWTDERQQQVSSVRIYDPRWQTREGIAVRTSVIQLQELFGAFQFYGFAWDYSGYLIQGNPKLDQYRKGLNLDFHIGLPDSRCQQEMSSDCKAVLGEQELSSTDVAVRRLNAQVVFISVAF